MTIAVDLGRKATKQTKKQKQSLKEIHAWAQMKVPLLCQSFAG